MLVTPPGATLRARFSSVDQAEPLMHAWGNLTHTLSGLFCSSLNFMVGPNMNKIECRVSLDHGR